MFEKTLKWKNLNIHNFSLRIRSAWLRVCTLWISQASPGKKYPAHDSWEKGAGYSPNSNIYKGAPSYEISLISPESSFRSSLIVWLCRQRFGLELRKMKKWKKNFSLVVILFIQRKEKIVHRVKPYSNSDQKRKS